MIPFDLLNRKISMIINTEEINPGITHIYTDLLIQIDLIKWRLLLLHSLVIVQGRSEHEFHC